MAAKSKDVQRVIDVADPRIRDMGLDLVDVEMVREGQKRILRVYIDKAGGVSLDDCTAVSRMLDPIVDEQLGIKTHDFFEVSSPGLERPLKTKQDFVRYEGEWVEVSLYRAREGQKKFQGTLLPYEDDAVDIRLEDETKVRFERSDIARVRRMLKM